MVATIPVSGPVVATEDERSALADLASLLDAGQAGIRLVGPHGTPVELPDTVRRLLHQMVHALVQDRPVAVVALRRELTIRDAANLLDAPIPYVVQLLDRGDIASTETDAQRRIRFEDVMAYKARRDVERRAAMAELVRLTEEMGLYENDDVPGPARQE